MFIIPNCHVGDRCGVGFRVGALGRRARVSEIELGSKVEG